MTTTRRFSILAAAVLVLALLGGYSMGANALEGGGTQAVAGVDAAVQVAHEKSSDDFQDEIEQTEDERKAAERRSEQLEHELEHTDAKIIEANDKLRALEDELPALQKALDEANKKVEAAEVEQQIVADRLAAAEAQERAIAKQIADDELRMADLEALVAAIARETYKGADASAGLGIVFGSEDTQEFVDQYTAQQSSARVQSNALAELEEIAAVNRNRAARQEAVGEYIAELKVEVDALLEEVKAARVVAEAARDEMQVLLDEQQELRDYLESQRDAFIAQQKENERLQEQLRNQVLNLYTKKRAAEEKERAAAAAAAANSGKLVKGALSFPTKVPYKTSSYGIRYHPIYHYPRMHAGTDLRAYCGTPIYASATGTVEWATRKGGYGNQVLIDHGFIGGKSVITNYNHLSRFAVSSGQKVARGDVVGYSGTTGTSTACHLHFEVYVSGSVVNPESLLPNFP